MMNFLRRTINLYAIMVLSIILSIVAALLTYFLADFYGVKNFNKVLDGFLLFITISIGFFGTCVSILATLISAPIMQIVFGDNSYKYQFIGMVLFAMSNGIVGIILTIIFQMTFGETEHGFFNFLKPDVISALWVFTSLNYLISLFLVTLISMAILFKSQNPIPQTEVFEPELKDH